MRVGYVLYRALVNYYFFRSIILFAFVTDLGDMESVFREFDSIIFERTTAENLFGLLDASSLLWRLNTMGIEVGEERWKKVTDALATHVNNHRSPWLVIY